MRLHFYEALALRDAMLCQCQVSSAAPASATAAAGDSYSSICVAIGEMAEDAESYTALLGL